MKNMKLSTLLCTGLVILVCPILYAQLLVKNSADQEVMRVTQDGMLSIRSALIDGRVNVDKPGNVFQFPGNEGTNTALIGYQATFARIDGYSNYNQVTGIGAWVYANAPSNTSSFKVDNAVKGALYLNFGQDQRRSITTGVLGMNRGRSNSRDIAGIFGSLDNVDDVLSTFSNLSNIAAIKAQVNTDGFDPGGPNASKVYSLHCSGTKSYIESPLIVGKATSLPNPGGEEELLIYNNLDGKAANLILKGRGDDVRYSNIQLGRTDNERKWLINYHKEQGYVEYLTFTFYDLNNYHRWVQITPTGQLLIHRELGPTPQSVLHVRDLPVANDNSDAISQGLIVGDFYRTSTGAVRVVY